MKNKFFHFAGVFSLCVLLFAFNSCSDVLTSNEEKGAVSFVIDGAALRSAFASGRAASIDSSAWAADEEGEEAVTSSDSGANSDYTEPTTSYELTIALCGDYSDSKSVTLTEDAEKATVLFDDIPVGRTVTAVACVNMKQTYDGKTYSHLEYFGSSEAKKISLGTNSLSFNLKSAHFYNDKATYYGKAGDREKYPAQFTLNIGKEKSGTGMWSITYYPTSSASSEDASSYFGIVSLGAYKVDSRNSDNNPASVSITEYLYQDLKGEYQFAKTPQTQTINLEESFSVTLAQIGTISFSESAISEYNLTVYYDASGTSASDYTLFPSIYTKSGTVAWEYGSDFVSNYSAAVKDAFEAIGYTYRYFGYSSSPNTGVADVDVYFYGTRAYRYTNATAFFPTGYEGKTVKAWYSRTETKTDEQYGTVTKTYALFLFEDGTFVQTKYKAISDSSDATKKTIEATGTYTLNDDTGTMTANEYKVDGQAMTCDIDIILGDVLVQNFTEYYGKTLDGAGADEPWEEAVECFIGRTDDPPEASDPTE